MRKIFNLYKRLNSFRAKIALKLFYLSIFLWYNNLEF
jgi:hypothetical protein